jgi:hypothetical protein
MLNFPAVHYQDWPFHGRVIKYKKYFNLTASIGNKKVIGLNPDGQSYETFYLLKTDIFCFFAIKLGCFMAIAVFSYVTK